MQIYSRLYRVNRIKILIQLVFITLVSFMFACEKKNFISGQDVRLDFSVDTICFDTVFSSFSSITKELRIVNNNKGWIGIDRIELLNTNSSFRLNINGIPQNRADNIDIAPGDSIFVFVDMLFQPVDNDEPVFLYDKILFEYNGISQSVFLSGWGQDVIFCDKEVLSTTIWDSPKPYYINNSVLIDTGEVLTVKPGSEIYFNRGASMNVAGSLVIEGAVDSKVILASARRDEYYSEVPGQWKGIEFYECSSDNIIQNATIRNAENAISVMHDPGCVNITDISLTNVVISHCSESGIVANHADLKAVNCVIADNGRYSLYIIGGGKYSFIHCTVYNTSGFTNRYGPGIVIADYYEYNGSNIKCELDTVRFINTVLTGDMDNEIEILSYENEILNCEFTNSFITIDESNPVSLYYNLNNSVIGSDPCFIAPEKIDLRPDSLSPLLDKANLEFALVYNLDIRNFSRLIDDGPDIGAYERQRDAKAFKH